jgi:hypothetical protein
VQSIFQLRIDQFHEIVIKWIKSDLSTASDEGALHTMRWHWGAETEQRQSKVSRVSRGTKGPAL